MAKFVDRSLHLYDAKVLRQQISMAKKFFTVDARAMLTLGRESIKDHTTAVLELVKNSYDAEASIVDILINVGEKPSDGHIKIVDDGHGMNEDDVGQNWLRLGYSSKREEKLTKIKGRRKVGEKGIGRISADRLGSLLELRSQKKSCDSTGLSVRWDDFDRPGTDLAKIAIDVIDRPDFEIPLPATKDPKTNEFNKAPSSIKSSASKSGTELTIRGLRQNWTSADIEELHRELSTLTSPFEDVPGFQIRIMNSVDPTFNGVVSSTFDAVAEIDARFSFKANRPIKIATTDRSSSGKVQKAVAEEVQWSDFVHPLSPPALSSGVQTSAAQPAFGPLEVRLLFFLRSSETIRGTQLSLTDLRDFLSVNGGVKIYRDNIRVLPYGDLEKPDGDWLGLAERKAQNPAGASREDFRINANQLVGAVLLTRDGNPDLVDTSGREGLVQGDAFNQLRQFLLGCVLHLETHYHEAFKRRKDEQRPPPNPREQVLDLKGELQELASSLKQVETDLPRGTARKFEKIRDQLGDAQKKLAESTRSIEELASQTTIYRSLATLGIAASTFGHETSAAIDSLLMHVNTAKNVLQLDASNVGQIASQIEEAIRSAGHVSSWGNFALKRLNRDKRRRRTIKLHSTVDELLNDLQPLLKKSDVELRRDLAEVEARVFAMDIESVVLNLVTNAYYFAKTKSRNRVVSVKLSQRSHDGTKGVEIVVGDSGPGVPLERQDRIWDALYSTKVDAKGRPAGTGLGLNIVQSVVSDVGGKREVSKDSQLGGARFKNLDTVCIGSWMPKIALIDDRKTTRDALEINFKLLLPRGWNCVTSAPLQDPSKYVEWIMANDIQVIVIDWVLDEQAGDVEQSVSYKGNAVVNTIRKQLPSLPVFVVTAHPKDEDLLEHEGDVERIFTRNEFTQDVKKLIKPMIRAGERFAKQYQDELNELGKLASKVASGKADDNDRAQLRAIQVSIGLVPEVEKEICRSEALDAFDKQLREFEQLKNKIQDSLISKKNK